MRVSSGQLSRIDSRNALGSGRLGIAHDAKQEQNVMESSTRLVCVGLLAPVLACVFGGGATASAQSVPPYFTALPPTGQTELQIGRLYAAAAPLPNGDVLI